MAIDCYKNQNRYSGKTYEVLGYTADADTYCPKCAEEIYPTGTDKEGNEVYPIFADNEWGTPIYCAACGEFITGDEDEAFLEGKI